MYRRSVVTVLVGAFALGACGGQGPSPEEEAQMRRDSIAAAQAEERRQAEAERQERLAEERRRREEAEQRQRALAAREARRASEIIAERVRFGYDQAQLSQQARERLIRKVAVLRNNPEIELRISGHADERGSVEYNLALGMRRAESIKDFLTGYGLDADRFETVSFGEERPADPASNERAWAENRRAEFDVIAGGDRLEVTS